MELVDSLVVEDYCNLKDKRYSCTDNMNSGENIDFVVHSKYKY